MLVLMSVNVRILKWFGVLERIKMKLSTFLCSSDLYKVTHISPALRMFWEQMIDRWCRQMV